MGPQRLLAADLGKTGCRVRVTDQPASDQTAERYGAVTGAVGLAAADGAERVAATVLAAARSAGLSGSAPDEIDVVAVGMAGYHSARDRLADVAARLHQIWPTARTVFAGDATTSHLGALGGQPGVVVAAGTGAVALAVGPGGEPTRRDGWGFLLGDDGSGYQIGRAGLRAALAHGDGGVESAALAAAAERHFGALTQVLARVYTDSHPSRLIAGFAPVVAEVARSGDPTARRIWGNAGRALADTAARAAAGLAASGADVATLPVCLTGGLADVGDLLQHPFAEAVAARWRDHGWPDPVVVAPAGDSLAGAQTLSGLVPPPFASLVTSFSPGSQSAIEEGPGTHLGRLATEQVAPGLADLDLRGTEHLIRTLWEAEATVAPTLLTLAPALAAVVDAVVPRFADGGRLIYVGAGTPGRLGFVDASELPPTYGVDPSRVIGLMAGGRTAFETASEGAEDDQAAGVSAVDDLAVGPRDTVVGLAASGRTPYVVAAVSRARERGALTVAVVNNPGSQLARRAEHAIEVLTGPEVVTGSTRLKAGTSQKMLLNALSTAVMVRSGKTLGSLMVDMTASNEKLRERAIRMTSLVTGADDAVARAALEAAQWRTTVAIVMLNLDLSAEAAAARLRACGSVRAALEPDPA